jgi:hypothetical protein
LYTSSTVAQFKAQFVRDFPYSTDINLGIVDGDITNAFNMVDITIDQDMWTSQSAFTMAYNLLAAHFLVLNIRASTQGINGQYNFLQNSKAAGPLSEGFTIPQRVIDNPDFAQYFKTNYGAQYMHLLWPQLAGQVFNAYGSTRP